MLFLTAFLGLFLVTEFRKSATNDSVRDIVNAPLLMRVTMLRSAIHDFETALASHAGGDGTSNAAELVRLHDDITKNETVLSALLLAEALNAHENVGYFDLIREIKKQTVGIRKALPVLGEKLSGAALGAVRDGTMRLVHATRELSLRIDRAHKAEADHLLEKIASYERQRSLFASLVLLSGLILVLSLLDHMCRYRSNAERALAAEKRNAIFEAALSSTRVGVMIRDMRKEGTPVAFVNKAFSQLTGYTIDDIKGHTSEFLFGWNTDPAGLVSFRRAVALHETATLNLLLYRKDGSPFWSEWHLSPVLDDDGVLIYFVSLFTDITALRQTQDDLIQAKQVAQHASAIKTNFLAMMSHEIRTPINGILGVLKLLEETRLDPEQKHLVGIAKTSSNALHGIINDILDYAKMEAGKVEIFEEPFSLPELLDGCIGLFGSVASEKDVALRFDLDPDLPAYFASDAGRIRQIILNLLSNAIKFTDKGSVSLRVFGLMEQEVGGEAGRLIRFEVQDTGVGISQADQEKLFQEFSQVERSFTRRFGGTGLGLAISRRLIGLLGGEIGVESQPGKGSRFWFMVPLRIATEPLVPPREEGSRADAAPLARGVYHILLVEDNDTNRLVARRYLEKTGFLVEEATNGLEAIEKAKIADFDLILMDVSMPEMDGMLATCHIRALGGHNARVPVIALTAHVMAGDRELCLAAGMNDYLHKPLEYNELLRAIGRWLRAPSLASGVTRPQETIAPQPSRTESSWRGSALPDIDPDILARMADDLGQEAVEQITQVFLNDSAGRMKAFETEDREMIQNAAHTLKSCSGNCGLKRFSKLMESLEGAAARGETERINELIPFVEKVYASAREKLEEERRKYTT